MGDPNCEECGHPLNILYGVCTRCCDHKYDLNEGGHCEYCGAEPDWGNIIDRAKDRKEYEQEKEYDRKRDERACERKP